MDRAGCGRVLRAAGVAAGRDAPERARTRCPPPAGRVAAASSRERPCVFEAERQASLPRSADSHTLPFILHLPAKKNDRPPPAYLDGGARKVFRVAASGAAHAGSVAEAL
ncbi:hypothetical protein MTO96_031241 [Rhipicephalus appendiculatus]